MSGIVDPRAEEAAWRKGVDAQLRSDRAPQLVRPTMGFASPYGGATAPTSSWYVPVTNAAFDGSQACRPWIIVLDRIVHTALRVDVEWTTEAGTTGELRLNVGLTTSAIALPAASSGVASFKWVHGYPLWAADVFVYLEARRTAGANNVNVRFPRIVQQCAPDGCTATGV